jgi:hypothetical protein
MLVRASTPSMVTDVDLPKEGSGDGPGRSVTERRATRADGVEEPSRPTRPARSAPVRVGASYGAGGEQTRSPLGQTGEVCFTDPRRGVSPTVPSSARPRDRGSAGWPRDRGGETSGSAS